jgi:hypothetical protein
MRSADAHQSVWLGRQLPPHQQQRIAGADPPLPRSRRGQRSERDLLANRLAAAGVSACIRSGETYVFALERWEPAPEELQLVNDGTGLDLTILELVNALAAATGYQGEICWDASKPDGTPKSNLM